MYGSKGYRQLAGGDEFALQRLQCVLEAVTAQMTDEYPLGIGKLCGFIGIAYMQHSGGLFGIGIDQIFHPLGDAVSV